jgi:hypothetical protein
MINAFRTAEGAEAWTPSVVKELMKIGPKNAFAMVQIDYSQPDPFRGTHSHVASGAFDEEGN